MSLDAEIPNSTYVIESGLVSAMSRRKSAWRTHWTVHAKTPAGVPQSIPKDPRQRYTLGHLLMKITMKQHEFMYALGDSKRHYPRMKWMFIVAVMKGTVNGVERWFPEIEIRIPKEHWYRQGS